MAAATAATSARAPRTVHQLRKERQVELPVRQGAVDPNANLARPVHSSRQKLLRCTANP